MNRLKSVCMFGVAAGVSLLLGACQTTTSQTQVQSEAPYTRILADNISLIMGKRLQLDGNYIALSEDGSFSGQWASEPIEGTWEMKDDLWCRVLTEFHQADRLNSEDCQLFEFNGTSVRVTRDKGNGQSFIYTVE